VAKRDSTGSVIERLCARALLFLGDDRGATAIEYGIIVAGISVAIISALTVVGSEVGSTFSGIATAVDNAIP